MQKALFTILIFISTYSFSQEIDTNIFSSKFEQNVFKKYQDSLQFDNLKLFSALQYKNGDYKKMRSDLDNIYNELKAKGIEKKKLNKQIKIIYKTIHSKLLKKYNENIIFNKILTSGEYNCVTATALYALILDKFGIPYAIRKKPNHVYLIASPGDQDIIMESTNPQKGVIVFDDKAKKDYVKYLYNNKLISKNEYNYNSTKELFDKYYNKDDTINLVQLAGEHYYNHALSLYSDDKFEYAMNELEKANILFPNDEILSYAYTQIIIEVLNKKSKKKEYDGKLIAKLVNLNSTNEELIDNALNIFKSISNEMLIENSALNDYKELYIDFKNTINDSINLIQFDDIYNYDLSYYYLMNTEYSKSLQTINKYYKRNPDNLNAKSLIHDSYAKMVYSFKDSRNEDGAMDSIQKYYKTFPFLSKYEYFQTIYSISLFYKMGGAFKDNNAAEGHLWLSKIDSIYSSDSTFSYDKDFVRSQLWSVFHFYDRYRTNYDSIINIFTRMNTYFPDISFINAKIEEAKSIKRNHGVRRDNNVIYTTYTPKARKKKVYTKEEYKKKFKKEFVGKWKSTKYRFPNTKTYINQKLQIFDAKTSTVEYIHDGKKIKGDWSLRPGAKYLYIVPFDHSSYIVFKVVKISENKLEIRLYSNNKLSDKILIFEKIK